jgi:predicted transcriptional regulator
MSSAKQQLRSMIDTLPRNCSVEDAIYRLYVLHRIQQGEEDIRKGRTVTHDRVNKEMDEWLSKLSGPKGRKKS